MAKKGQKQSCPFYSMHKGVLSQSIFVSLHSGKAEGILVDIEPFYVAATFGLLAVDILTTTGTRANELLQLNSNSKEDYLKAIKINGDLKFSFKAIPKGEIHLSLTQSVSKPFN